jgi:hypothetical protein
MSTDEIEKLMIEVIHFLSDQFPNQAILKGGMELRLIDCPRYTNDLQKKKELNIRHFSTILNTYAKHLLS